MGARELRGWRWIGGGCFALLLGAPALPAMELGQARLEIAGSRLSIAPESQTVPFDTPTLIETTLHGYDPAAGPLPASLRVRGDLSGPEIDGVLTLETAPNEPFRIPRLQQGGEYRLEDIRLIDGEQVLAYASPRSAAILVTQVLVTRVSSRPLTLDEIRGYGIAIDEDSFRAFDFTFGFAVDGETFDYHVPVLFGPAGSVEVLGGDHASPATEIFPRFHPPQVAPFQLELPPSEHDDTDGGCVEVLTDCETVARVPLPGVILFPADVRLLHQFFSVVLVVQNGAPAGDALVLRDLTARLSLPPGLRLAETEPPTHLGTPLPIRVPGPDGRLGTADDLSFLIAQGSGEAEALVEGLREGTHIVEFDIAGVLDGLPAGPRPVSGVARGAVLVRDPTLGITISHPEVVRADEQYSLLLTVTNTGSAPANLVTVELDLAGLSGVDVIGETSKTIPSLLPGDAGLLEFRLRSRRTGRVISTGARVGGGISPRFELTVAVGEAGAPLSPTTILLPRATEHLPDELVRQALNLIGLGFSLATAPPAPTADRPQVSRAAVDGRVFDLMQAGRAVGLGGALFESAAVLAAEWLGSRDADWEWDRLRRTTRKGAAMSAELGEIFAAEAQASSAMAAFERLARATAHLPVLSAAVATGSGAHLELESRTSGKRLAGFGAGSVRELPFAELYALPSAELGLLAVPEAGGFRARVTKSGGGLVDLTVLLPSAGGELQLAEWSNVSLGAAGLAVAEIDGVSSPPRLVVDSDGDGVPDDDLPATLRTLPPPAFEVLAAVPNYAVDPSGHVVDVLFSADIDRASLLPKDPARFAITGKLSNGGVGSPDSAQSSGQPSGGIRRSARVLTVVFDNPLSPYTDHTLTVRNVRSVTGAVLAAQTVSLAEVPAAMPGGLVAGRVIGADGQPVAGGEVKLIEWDFCPTCLFEPCRPHTTAAVRTDAAGQFLFDYVRQNPLCGGTFELRAKDLATGHRIKARNTIRLVGETVQMDLVMRGRGTVRGLLRYDDGGLVREPSVIAFNPAAGEGRRAIFAAGGAYEVGEVPAGTVTLTARDGQGGFVHATVEVPSSGAVVERDLTIPRRPSGPAPGGVRGRVLATDGSTPVRDAYVALYVEQRLVAVERSDAAGQFDFGSVPSGLAEIEAFDGASGQLGTHVYFEIDPDRISEVTLLLRDERGTVEGHVYRRGPSGVVPLAGAAVWIEGSPLHTTTDAGGFYRLVGVFEGNRSVKAANPERTRQVSAAVSVAGGAVSTADLYFDEVVAGGIAGRVLGFDGAPVSGATVHLQLQDYYWARTAISDSDGRFELPNLGPGTYSVHAFVGAAGGKATAEIRFVGDTPFVTLRFKKGIVRGRVLADTGNGTPAGVQALVTYRTTTVRYELVGLDNVERTLETAADGTFELPEALVGPYVLTVRNSFHGTTTVRGELVNHGQINEHELVLGAAGEIRGHVLQPDGVTPAAGATVKLRHPGTGAYDVTADADGRFVFALVAPHASRFAIDAEWSGGGLFRQGRIWVALPRANQELDVEIVLPKQGSVLGWVEDASALRVAGAVVSLQEHEYPHRRLTANSDLDGLFAFHNVFAGTVTVSAQAPQLGGLGGKTTVELADENEEEFAIVRLEPVGEIEGRVLSPVDGAPVSGVAVRLYRGTVLVDRTTSESDGVYRFRQLKLATYEARAFDPASGRNGRRSSLAVASNNQVVAADLTLEARGEVRGHLYEPQSTVPIPAATVKLQTGGLTRIATYSSTGADGLFEFLGVPEGPFDLDANEPGGRRRAHGAGEIVSEGQQFELDLFLDEIGTVVGTVLNPVGAPSGPFENANPRIVQDSTVVGASLGSSYAFDRILVGRGFKILADEVGGLHKGEAKGKLGTHGQELRLDVRMVPIGTVLVSVVTSTGAPVPGAAVTLNSTGFYGNKTFAGGTGGDHEVSFANVGAGELSAFATDPVTGLRGSARGNLVNEGELVSLQLALESSGEVRGRVLMPDGVTPASDTLIVLDRSGTDLRAFTDVEGNFLLPAVPMGPFSVLLIERFGLGRRTVYSQSLTASGQVLDLGTLVLDDRDPEVTVISPANGTTDQPLGVVIRIDFSEPLNPARMFNSYFTLRKVAGSTIPTTRTWSNGNRTVTLYPSSSLTSATRYELVVWKLEDTAGREIEINLRSTFTTADVIRPTVIEMLPRAGTVNATAATQPRLTFSEPVAFLSLSGTALQLTDLTAGTGVTTTFTLLPGEREVLLTPAEALPLEHRFRLTVQGVQDLSGNTLSAPFVSEFETLDVTPPRLVRLAPAAGASFVAGAPVSISVEAFDNRGVVSTTFLLGDRTASDGARPFTQSLVAPNVSAEQDVPITVRAIDVAGNVGEISWPIRVSPNDDPGAPNVSLAPCLRGGDFVWPGVPQPIGFTVSDDQGVASYQVLVDGVVVESTTASGAATVAATHTWTPPAAAPGTSFVVEVRGSDFAGNTGAALVTLVVPTAPVLGSSTNLFSTLHNGRALVLAGGTFTVQDALSLESLTLLAGARVVSTAGMTLDLTVSGLVRLQCGASLDVSGQGSTGSYYIAPTSYGETPVRPGAYLYDGGSHGGVGAKLRVTVASGQSAAPIYDSVAEPRLVGGAGGLLNAPANGSGGGALRLRAAELQLDGEILARGLSEGSATHKTGGAGGSILLELGLLGGAGRLDAGGGAGLGCLEHQTFEEFYASGGGGGGRVGLLVDQLDGFDLSRQASLQGGSHVACGPHPAGYAGAGTLYLRTAGMVLGELHIDQGLTSTGVPRGGPATELPALPAGSIAVYTADGADAWVTASGAAPPVAWIGAWIVLADGAGAELGAFRVADRDSSGRLRLTGAASVSGALSFRGEHRFDRIELGHGAGVWSTAPVVVTDLEVGGSSAAAPSSLGTITASNVTVRSGAVLRPRANREIALVASNELVIEAGAVIDAEGQGYSGHFLISGAAPQGATPPGVLGAEYSDGGSHGGPGMASGSLSGEVYDSVYQPAFAGASGGLANYTYEGGAGGALVRLEAPHIRLDGEIRAGGAKAGWGSGGQVRHTGGAGGSVVVTAGSLTGVGSIDASGGGGEGCVWEVSPQTSAWQWFPEGSGGGGRVALLVNDLSAFDFATRTTVVGGAYPACETISARTAGSGTLYVHQAGSTFGELFVAGTSSLTTELPKLGTGIVGAVSAGPAGSLWITPQDPAATFDVGVVGMWVRVAGADYRVLEQSLDRRSVRLEGAAGLVTVGLAYEGVYKFDRVTVRGTAKLGVRDADVIGEVVTDPGAVFWHRDRVKPVLGTITPPAGTIVEAGTTMAVTALATDDVAVGVVHFTFNGQALSDSAAPYEAAFTLPSPAVPAAYNLVVEAVDTSGNRASATRSITVSPDGDFVPPLVTLTGCPAAEDRFVPGVAVSVPFTAGDAEGVVSYTLLVRGAVVQTVTVASATSVNASLVWTPPVSYEAGGAYELMVEARDAAGNVGRATVVLRGPSGTVLSGTQNLTSALNGQALTLGSGTFTATEPLALAALALAGGAKLTSPQGVTLDLDVTGELRVQCGTSIDLTGKGYLGGHTGHPNGYAPTGISVAKPDYGGSYGGAGNRWDGTATAPGGGYGSLWGPMLAGSGGAQATTSTSQSGFAGAGGGLLLLDAGQVVLGGDILVKGGAGSSASAAGGSGGAVNLRAGSLTGGGKIDASGASTTSDGPGGGGRIAVVVTALDGFDPLAQLTAQGGRLGTTVTRNYGAPGTVYVRTGNELYGRLILDQVTLDGVEPPVTKLLSMGGAAVAAWAVEGGDGWLSRSTAFTGSWIGPWIALFDAAGAPLGTFRSTEIDGSGRLRLEGAGAVAAPASYRAEYRFDRLDVRNRAALSTTDPLWVGTTVATGNAKLPARIAGNTLTVTAGSTVGAASNPGLELELAQRLTIEAGAVLHADGVGYSGGVTGHPNGYAPDGVAASTPDAGGSHGGTGRSYHSGAAGAVFDSVYLPRLGGGGAAQTTTSTSNTTLPGAGGGVLSVRVPELVLDGTLRARGACGTNASLACGAGGTVFVDTGLLRGAGSIDAAANTAYGTYDSTLDGPGGGGRVALYVDQFQGFDPLSRVNVEGGRSGTSATNILAYAAAGTLLVWQPGMTHGELILGNTYDPAEPFAATELPALGSGFVAAWNADGADAWLTGATPFAEHWLGVTVIALDAAGQELGALRVLELDAAGRLRLEGGGAVSGAVSFRGEYRFDRIRFGAESRLSASDRVWAGETVVVAGSSVQVPPKMAGQHVLLEADSTVKLVSGSVLEMKLTGRLEIEAGAALYLVGAGYSGGKPGAPTSHPNGYAPSGVGEATPDYGGSHGGLGSRGDGTGTSAGEIYDSVYYPALPGAGGSSSTSTSGGGGPGGGVLLLEADEVILDGEIWVRGDYSYDASGSAYEHYPTGAGGSVQIKARLMSGGGWINARGVNTDAPVNHPDGSGGGGRIALYVDTFNGFDPETRAWVRGGRRYAGSNNSLVGHAGPGTVYVKQPHLAFGKLYVAEDLPIAGDTVQLPVTSLPSIGGGVIGVAEAHASGDGSLWIEPQDAAAKFSLGVTGMWVRVNGSDYRVLEQANRRRIRLEGAAGVVDVGQSYQGRYKFDVVYVKGRARLRFVDPYDAGLQVEAGSEVVP